MIKMKRLCAAMLALSMSAAMLSGCQHKTDTSAADASAADASAADASAYPAGTKKSGKDSTGSSEAAMGRYIEEAVLFPWEEGMADNHTLQLIQRDDGQVFLYAAEIDPELPQFNVLCYAWTENGWEEKESKLHHAKISDPKEQVIDILSIRQSTDGTEYLAFIDWATFDEEAFNEGQVSIETSLLKAGPDGSCALYPGTPMATVFSPDYAHVFDNDTFLLSSKQTAGIYAPDNALKHELLQSYCPTNYRTLAAARKLEYVTLAPEENNLLRYNIESGTAVETIPLVKPDTAEAFAGAAVLDPDGNLYLANAGGIHCWKKGGSIWETLADGNLNSLSMPSLEIKEIVLGRADDYLVLASDSTGGNTIMRFFYEPNVPSVPADTLSIFSLSDNPTIRQAITQYQNQNPNVRVNYQVGDGGAAITDTIKALNTELVNKNGADILILDGLPVADYIEKGVLADLSELIAPMLAENILLPQAVGDSSQDNGPIYNVSVRFWYPVMYGTPEGMAAMKSLQTVRDYNGSVPLFANKNHGEILKLLMNLYHAELFADDGMITEENLVLLLETAKEIHARGLDPDLENMKFSKEQYNFVTEYGMSNADSFMFRLEKAAVTAEILETPSALMLPADLCQTRGVKPATANGIYFPSTTAGINSSSSQKELAQEFIRLMLSEEIQAAQLLDGFPVNRAAFERWRTFRDDNSMIGGSLVNDDGTLMEYWATWPAQKQQDEFFDLQKEMVKPVMTDRVLMEIITDEAKTFFDGNTDAAKAADAISSRAAMYLAE